jgi:uncharacterized Tic20 family protein
MWAMFCHISAIIGFVIPFGNIVAPLVLWALKKDEYKIVNLHGKEAINFQISITIYVLISILLIFIVIGIPILIALGIFELIAIIIAAVKANEGKLYHYPLSIRFLN